jgi:hypothetical protein
MEWEGLRSKKCRYDKHETACAANRVVGQNYALCFPHLAANRMTTTSLQTFRRIINASIR